MTSPRTWWGRPKSAAAPATSPAASSSRMRVDETAPESPISASSTPAVTNPSDAPKVAEERHVALAAVAEVEVLADHDQAGAEGADEDRAHEVLGRLVGAASSKGTTSVRSTPQSASSSSFWSRSVSRRGADSGRTTMAGWRSKVTTTVERPRPAAWRWSWPITKRWPRCTPS